MRKAEKRARGEQRAQAYLEEERQRRLEAQRIDNQIRAEKAARKAEEEWRKRGAKAIRDMAAGQDIVDESSLDLECAG